MKKNVWSEVWEERDDGVLGEEFGEGGARCEMD